MQAADHHQGAEHPAHIGDPAQHVAGLQVKGVAEVDGRLEQVAKVRVHDALGQTGGARGVDDEKRMVGVQRLGGWRRPGQGRGHVFPPVVPTRHHGNGFTRVGHHHQVLHRRREGHRAFGDLFHGHRLATACGAIGGDQHFGLRGLQPCGQRLAAVAREGGHHHRADLGAAQNDHRCLGHGRHEQRHPVPLAHAQGLQAGGKAVDLGLELGEGQAASAAVVAFVGDGCSSCLLRVGRMAVDAAVDDVERGAGEPAREGAASRLVTHLLHRATQRDAQVLGGSRPEPLRAIDRGPVKVLHAGKAPALEGSRHAAASDMGQRGPPNGGFVASETGASLHRINPWQRPCAPWRGPWWP